jgi:hypothetical protein
MNLGEKDGEKVMKKFFLQIYYRISDNKIEFVSYTCMFVPLLIIFFWQDIIKLFPPGRSTEIWSAWLATFNFFLFGIVGVTFILMKKAPIFIIPIRGIPAIIIGAFLTVASFGLVIRLIILNSQLLFGH